MGVLGRYISPRNIVLMHISPINNGAFAINFKNQKNIKVFDNKMESIILNID